VGEGLFSNSLLKVAKRDVALRRVLTMQNKLQSRFAVAHNLHRFDEQIAEVSLGGEGE